MHEVIVQIKHQYLYKQNVGSRRRHASAKMGWFKFLYRDLGQHKKLINLYIAHPTVKT